jgi:hypothetical protein
MGLAWKVESLSLSQTAGVLELGRSRYQHRHDAGKGTDLCRISIGQDSGRLSRFITSLRGISWGRVDCDWMPSRVNKPSCEKITPSGCVWGPHV